ncbi:MAG TPA: hypothetical protein VF243_03875 [Nitrosospira sp.]
MVTFPGLADCLLALRQGTLHERPGQAALTAAEIAPAGQSGWSGRRGKGWAGFFRF